MENKRDDQNSPGPDAGNASNPAPHNREMEPNNNNQLFGDTAEKYLRESGNIEDIPDAQDQHDADEMIKKQNKP